MQTNHLILFEFSPENEDWTKIELRDWLLQKRLRMETMYSVEFPFRDFLLLFQSLFY
jgi:hypothetical protein